MGRVYGIGGFVGVFGCIICSIVGKVDSSGRQGLGSLLSSCGYDNLIPSAISNFLLPNEVYDYLSSELTIRLLDELYAHLWLVAKKSGHQIDALHPQKAKGRSIRAGLPGPLW